MTHELLSLDLDAGRKDTRSCLSVIVSIIGNRRPNNFTALATAVVNEALVQAGATLEVFDGRQMELGFPGEPETADSIRLKQAVSDSDAVALATPEYHGTFSAYTKLVIENLGYPSLLSGKPVALLGVASGRIGAIKSLEHLRSTCGHNGAIVVPGALSIAGVRNAFDASGTCIDATTEQALTGLATNLLEFLHNFVRPKQILEEMIRDGHEPPWTTRS